MDHDQRIFAVQVVEKLRRAGYQALWAGGCVRDLLMGKQPKDYDVATNATPDQVIELFGKRKTVAVGAAFGVIIVIAPVHYHNVEVATFRNDGIYSDGRRPDQVIFSSPEEDAQRRDFTINGMFYDPISETVHDYVGGQADLKAGLIRAIGNPHDRIREDKLRMLRAIRFAARFNYQLEEVTSQAVKQHVDDLRQVSQERITDELGKMLTHHTRAAAIQLAEKHFLLRKVLHACQLKTDYAERLEYLKKIYNVMPNGHVMLAWTILFETLLDQPENMPLGEFVEQLAREFKMSNEQGEEIGWLWEHKRSLDQGEQLSLADLKIILSNTYAKELLKWMELRSLLGEITRETWNFCREYLAQTPAEKLNPEPLLKGSDLIKLGYRPGPEFKELLQLVRLAQLNEEIFSREEAEKLIRDHSAF